MEFSVGKETTNNFKTEKAFCSAVLKVVYRRKSAFKRLNTKQKILQVFAY